MPIGMNAASPTVSCLRSSPTHCSMVPLRRRMISSWCGWVWKSWPLSGRDLHVEHAELDAVGHVRGPHDPAEIDPQSSNSHSTSSTHMKHIGTPQDSAVLIGWELLAAARCPVTRQNVIALKASVWARRAASVGRRSMLDAP